MKRNVILLLALGIILGAGTSYSLAQQAKAAPAQKECDRKVLTAGEPPPQTFDEWAQQIKNPTPWMNWGYDLRLRTIYANNFLTLDKDTSNHEWHFQRYRSRLWANFTPLEDIQVYH